LKEKTGQSQMKRSKNTTKQFSSLTKNSDFVAPNHSPSLSVAKEQTLSFAECGTDNLPADKGQAKKVLETLIAFSDIRKLNARNPHPLKGGSANHEVNQIIQRYNNETLMSLDVGHRNGRDGNFRLLYYKDRNNPLIAKVLRLFIDTH
jgi:hypothetical protein